MGWYTKGRYFYPEPERYTPSVARARRLAALLEQDRRFADLQNFSTRQAALSQAINNAVSAQNRRFANDQKSFGHKAALIAAALSQFKESDFADPDKRKAYRSLRLQQEALRRPSPSMGGRQKVTPSGGDKRRYNPTGKSYAPTIYGGVARMVFPVKSLVRVFANPGSVIPCIQRSVRREVMFAKNHAGRGYRVKHRRTWSSEVPC